MQQLQKKSQLAEDKKNAEILLADLNSSEKDKFSVVQIRITDNDTEYRFVELESRFCRSDLKQLLKRSISRMDKQLSSDA